MEQLQKRIQREQIKYEPARNVSKTYNEIDSMGQKTITGKMAISKEDYSQLTALAKEGITSRAEISELEQSANYYRQKYFDCANALERMKTKYNELKEKNHAYEYVMREDIILAMEYHDLTDEQAKALLASPSPLADIFRDFEKIEGDHMDTIRHCVESRADKNIARQREELRNLPLYIFSAALAKERGELEIFRASHRANVDCKNAIEDAIANHYRDNHFDGSCVSEVAEKFGMDRVAFVLATTVQYKDWDGRISGDNKAWAKELPDLIDYNALGGRRNIEYVCSQAHPGLINLFVDRFRKEQELAAEKIKASGQ